MNDDNPRIVDFPQRFENDTPMQLLREIENEIRKGNIDNIAVVTHKGMGDAGCATRWGTNNCGWEIKMAMAGFLMHSVMKE